ncbi:MAG: V-type ATP synthase subunit E family protein [Candidatus Cloacimonetes bacterium]|nr:V-type ATP synthase subunit E [Candidatus Cloacimonadota bacterium]MDD4224205.1 V-type ATP synthase subunit E family protein [Candidatus Cloacimonadota bacterium]
MSDQLQDLLQRVYEEGVNKAKEEAEAILEKAGAEAEAILAKAKEEAAKTVSKAKQEAEDIAKNADSDLKMAAQNTLSSVKQKLTEVLLSEAFDPKLKEATSDPGFVQKLILEMVSAFKASGGSLSISKSLADKLEKGFVNSLPETAGKGLQVEFSPQMKNGFAISPADGDYKLSFTDEDFANLFKSFLRPRSNKILFKS